jgi:mRNA-degrading endonuclease toxin of MazEF toxin-antitoxin module
MPGQREVVEINFRLPDGTFKPHPVIVLSNDDINDNEGAFVCVMVSGNPSSDDYSFPLSEDMLTFTPRKQSQVRCHLITLGIDADIMRHFGHIRKAPFIKLINKINGSVFNLEGAVLS